MTKETLYVCSSKDCRDMEIRDLGHRIVYSKAGHSRNIWGCFHRWREDHQPVDTDAAFKWGES